MPLITTSGAVLGYWTRGRGGAQIERGREGWYLKMHLMVIENLCRGCGQCARSCPHGAIEMVGGTAQVDSGLCRGCELCIENCLQGALVFTQEGKGDRETA